MRAVRRDVDGTAIEELDVPEAALRLDLQPHPEGGWYRRVWTSPVVLETPRGPRPAATAVLFLLPPGESSVWHRVASDELWVHRGPGALALQEGGAGAEPAPGATVRLGEDRPQHLVPAGHWQRTLPSDEEVQVVCVVSPGFDFADFTARRDRNDP